MKSIALIAAIAALMLPSAATAQIKQTKPKKDPPLAKPFKWPAPTPEPKLPKLSPPTMPKQPKPLEIKPPKPSKPRNNRSR